MKTLSKIQLAATLAAALSMAGLVCAQTPEISGQPSAPSDRQTMSPAAAAFV